MTELPAEPPASGDVAQFKRRYEWIDESSVEVTLEIELAYQALSAAFRRATGSVVEARAPGRARVLRRLYLSEEGRLPQYEIGRQLSVTSANITQIIDGLEREGLVTRSVSSEDRRVALIELTPKGNELASKLVPLIAEFMIQTVDGMSETEKRTLVDLLGRFRCAAENARFDSPTMARD